MRKVLPWSYSSLTGYENCPHQFYEVRIAGTTPRKDTKEASSGVDIHKQIEDYCNGVASLEDKKLKKIVDKTLADLDKAFLKFEHKLAITQKREPTEWEAEDCHHRGIMDVSYINPDDPVAKVFDWKSGKVNAYSQQLKANALTIFAHYPHVQEVRTQYVWLKFDSVTPGRVFREFSDKIWDAFEKRVTVMVAAEQQNIWPKRPSGLCKRYCPVVTCEHNGEFSDNDR